MGLSSPVPAWIVVRRGAITATKIVDMAAHIQTKRLAGGTVAQKSLCGVRHQEGMSIVRIEQLPDRSHPSRGRGLHR